MTYVIHCTKRLLECIQPATFSASATLGETLLGNWYATALLWKPQLALLVNEKTLLPVLMPLTPAADLAMRFPKHLANVLAAHGIPRQFIDHELAQMNEVQYAKTSNRSVIGIMNQFSFLAEQYQEYIDAKDLLGLSLKLSETPCSPLYKTYISPKRALQAQFSNAQIHANSKADDKE